MNGIAVSDRKALKVCMVGKKFCFVPTTSDDETWRQHLNEEIAIAAPRTVTAYVTTNVNCSTLRR